jgi:hypothetical protein
MAPAAILFFSHLLGCGSGDERTLDSCRTEIASDVPGFYADYFRCVDISMDGDTVVIESTGLPPHRSAYYGEGDANYAEWDDSRGADYYLNPNVIAEQSISIEIPASPVSRELTIDGSLVDGEVGSSSDEYGMGTVGAALDGVSIFNSLAAPGDSIADEAYSFDAYSGHPEMSGNYHYHTTSAGPLEVLEYNGFREGSTPGGRELEIYGIMCDGSLVLGCSELDGSSPDEAGLDSQNGHLHDIADSDGSTHFTDRYHVHICPGTYSGYAYTPEIQYYQDCKSSN